MFEVEVRNGRELIRRETLCEKRLNTLGKRKGEQKKKWERRDLSNREPT